MNVTLRKAIPSDAVAIHALIAANLEAGHLLPRSLEDIQDHIRRFYVAVEGDAIVGCADLARLSATVAEVRSLVVQEAARGRRIGPQLVQQLARSAAVAGYTTLCAFTHDPSHFVRLGFTIVPHVWMPEKIEHDCTRCPLFRRCGQYAVRLGLQPGAAASPERSAPMVYGRGVAPRRPNVERLQLVPVPGGDDTPAAASNADGSTEREAVPA